MKMAFFNFSMILFFLAASTDVTAGTTGTLNIRLKEIISTDLKNLDQTGTTPEDQELMKTWKPAIDQERKKLNRLLKLIEQTPEDELPRALVDICFRNPTRRGQYPPLEKYLISLGGSAIAPLSEVYDSASEFERTTILVILGNIESREGLPVVRRGLKDSSLHVQDSAFNALRMILKQEAIPELEELLAGANQPDLLIMILRQLSILESPNWCRTFLELVQTEQLTLSDIHLIGDPRNCSEEILAQHTQTLTKHLSSEDLNVGSIARDFLLRVNEPQALKKLMPIVPQLISERFAAGGTIKQYDRYPEKLPQQLKFTDREADLLLGKIAAALTLEEIEKEAAQTEIGLLPRLYFQNLFAQKNGTGLKVEGRPVTLKIEALDENNKLLASSDYHLTIGNDEEIELKSISPDFPDHRLDLKINFDPINMSFKVDPMLIHLKPYGAGFTFAIPVEGSYEINLIVNTRNGRVPIRWVFSHLE